MSESAEVKPAIGLKRMAAKKKAAVREHNFIDYVPGKGLRQFAREVGNAEPMVLVGTERRGVPGRLLKDLAAGIGVANTRLFRMIGVRKATAEKKIASNALLKGAGGTATLGLVKLLYLAQRIVDDSTAAEAKGFDAARWLGEWIEQPQPALGGEKPGELLDTPTGMEIVANILQAMESGVYL